MTPTSRRNNNPHDTLFHLHHHERSIVEIMTIMTAIMWMVHLLYCIVLCRANFANFNINLSREERSSQAVPYDSGRIFFLAAWQDFGSESGFFSKSCPENKSCRSGLRNPGRKKFLPGIFGHPGRIFLPGSSDRTLIGTMFFYVNVSVWPNTGKEVGHLKRRNNVSYKCGSQATQDS